LELRAAELADDGLTFDFQEPARGTIDFRFRARRNVATTGEPILLTLPSPKSAHPLSTKLTIITADNVEAGLRPTEGILLPPVVESGSTVSVPQEWQSLRRADYRLESGKSDLLVSLSVHARKLNCTSELEAFIRGEVATTRQKFRFDVAYDRISQLRFSVPNGALADHFKFFTADNRKLASVVVPESDHAPAEIRVALETPSLGQVEVEAQQSVAVVQPRGNGTPAVMTFPVLQSLDVQITETELSVHDSAAREVSLNSPEWQRRMSPDGTFVWSTKSVLADVTLSLSRTMSRTSRLHAPKAFSRSVVTESGVIENRAQYRLAEGVSEIQITWPRELDISNVEFYWNRSILPVGPASAIENGEHQFDVVISDRGGNSDRVLTINYRSRVTTTSRLGTSYNLAAPRLPTNLRLGQVYWEVDLPYYEHVFTAPDGYAQAYRWEFGRPFWVREPEMSDQELQQWFGTASGPAPQPLRSAENHYLFATTGESPDLVFRAMRKWSLTLIGAGIALALGLLLSRWPAMYHPTILLAAVFAVAVIAVWYSEPVLILLQPAVLGIILAILAAGFQSLQRSRRRVQLAIGPSSGLSMPVASQSRIQDAAIGSNEQTSLRLPTDQVATPTSNSSRLSGQLTETGATR
jgi:hypothetical protein